MSAATHCQKLAERFFGPGDRVVVRVIEDLKTPPEGGAAVRVGYSAIAFQTADQSSNASIPESGAIRVSVKSTSKERNDGVAQSEAIGALTAELERRIAKQ